MSDAGSSDTVTLEIGTPDDWHVHLRDDDMLAAVTPFTSRCFRHALVMPNLVPPVTTTAMAAAYRDRILAAAGPDARPDARAGTRTSCRADAQTAHVEKGGSKGF